METYLFIDLNRKLKADKFHNSTLVLPLIKVSHVQINPELPQLHVALRPRLCGTSMRARHDGGLQQCHNPIKDYFRVRAGANVECHRFQNRPIILDGHEHFRAGTLSAACLPRSDAPAVDSGREAKPPRTKPLFRWVVLCFRFLCLNRYQDAAG